jgi:hypothetical protein
MTGKRFVDEQREDERESERVARARAVIGLPEGTDPEFGLEGEGALMKVVEREDYSRDHLLLREDVYDRYAAVEESIGTTGTVDRSALERQGMDIESAIDMHRAVVERMDRHESRKPLIPIRRTGNQSPPRTTGRSRLTRDEARKEALRLAPLLRVDFAVVEAKEPGARPDVVGESARIKRARALIALRLSELGASNSVIGQVLGGRTRQRILQLIQFARDDQLRRIVVALAAHEADQHKGGSDA